MDEAEHHTSRYYCIPPFRWSKLRYDLLTREDTEWEPLPERILARIQRLSIARRRSGEPLDFYRIILNDPSILDAVRREDLHSDFYPFLVYILTHEMVHLVRMSHILESAHEDPEARTGEESRVRRISSQILSRSAWSRFDPILEKFALNELPPR